MGVEMRGHLRGIGISLLIAGVLGAALWSSEYSSQVSDNRPVSSSAAPVPVPVTDSEMAGLKAKPAERLSPTPSATLAPSAQETLIQETVVESVPTDPVVPQAPPEPVESVPPVVAATQAPQVYYANCDEARAAGVAPIYIGEPGYRAGLDRDKDGIACET